MTPPEAIKAIRDGQAVECSREEYPAIRRALQDELVVLSREGDNLRGFMVTEEIRTLDRSFGITLQAYQVLE